MAQITRSQDAFRQWSAVAPAWEAERVRLFEMTRAVSERIVDRADPKPGQTVLELTAGPGETGFLAARRVGDAGHVISSDFVPAMVDAARRGAAAQGITNIDFRIIDAQAIDLPDDSVDVVVSRFGLMLVPDQARAMAEIRRVLRSGSRCAYGTWGPLDRNPWIAVVVMALMANDLALPDDPFAPGGVFSLSTADANRGLAEAAGFEDVTLEEVTGSMRFDSVEDCWQFQTSIAGPLAEVVSHAAPERLEAVRSTLGSNAEPYERDGGVELPWTAIVTTAT